METEILPEVVKNFNLNENLDSIKNTWMFIDGPISAVFSVLKNYHGKTLSCLELKLVHM